MYQSLAGLGVSARRICLRLPSLFIATAFIFYATTDAALAHAVTQGDKGYIQEIFGVHLIPFTYLGAKHMVTG